jgi:hypothetical protein
MKRKVVVFILASILAILLGLVFARKHVGGGGLTFF